MSPWATCWRGRWRWSRGRPEGSAAPEFSKKALLERGSDATTVTDVFSGLYARALRNNLAKEYEASGTPVLPALVRRHAAEVFHALVREARAVLASLPR